MHILLQQGPPTTPYLLLKPKQTIRTGDTIIFQAEVTDGEKNTDIEETKAIVETASTPDTEGLMKGWQVLTFKEEL